MAVLILYGTCLCCEDRWWNMEVATGNLTKFVQLVVIKVPIEATKVHDA